MESGMEDGQRTLPDFQETGQTTCFASFTRKLESVVQYWG